MENSLSLDVLFSMNALRRAWQQVRRNGDASGSDGINRAQFESKLDHLLTKIRQELLEGVYQPVPVRRFYVKKASGKQRPISIWAMRDRVVQRVIHDYLMMTFERLFLPCSYGYRLGRSVESAVQGVVRGRDDGLLWVLDADIADCFDSIPLDILMGQIRRVVTFPDVVNLIEQYLYTPVERHQGKVAGVSQGGVISPLLANLYLHRFDEMILASLPSSKLIRFADDFLILSHDEQTAVWSLDVARRSLENLRLKINMRKTHLVTFDEGFNFLGVTFKGTRYNKGGD